MNIKKLLVIGFLFLLNPNYALSDNPYFIDLKLILNQSDAGKKAQKYLKSKLDNGIKDLQQKEKKILDEEKKIIQQKKVLSQEEYKNKVTELRTKVSSLQKKRNSLLETVAKQRQKAKNELLKTLNPILSTYMKEKNINMVIDKKEVLLANENLNITKDIMNLLNKKLKSINLD